MRVSACQSVCVRGCVCVCAEFASSPRHTGSLWEHAVRLTRISKYLVLLIGGLILHIYKARLAYLAPFVHCSDSKCFTRKKNGDSNLN